MTEPRPFWQGENARAYTVTLPAHVADRVDDLADAHTHGDGAAMIARIVVRDLDPILAAQMEHDLSPRSNVESANVDRRAD